MAPDPDPAGSVSGNLARNLRQLRDARGLSQQQLATLAGIPRATWTNLESGGAKPTLAVLTRAAAALRVGIEELLAPPRARCRLFKASDLRQRGRGRVQVRDLLPDPLPGLRIERLRFAPGARFSGTPHTRGTREYLTCERGQIALSVGGETWSLIDGDVLAFPGDQRHGYANPGSTESIGYSVLVVAPGGISAEEAHPRATPAAQRGDDTASG
jgi:transcriptional regulator with XRE-family HTH domain